MAQAALIAVKKQVKKEGGGAPARQPIDRQLSAKVTEHELFMAEKRQEATLRDITGKAVCSVKYALRQPGAQADGRPAVPPNWDSTFKPQLGSFMKFVLGRPDQFRVTEGSGPGYYTVENLAGNKTAVAPSWDQKGKGKGKFWAKGNGKDKDKGKGKGKDKGKDAFAYGKDKGKGKSKGGKPISTSGGIPFGQVVSAEKTTSGPEKEHRTVLPRGARLLAAAAKQELAEDDQQSSPTRPATKKELAEADDNQMEEDGLGWEEDATADQYQNEDEAAPEEEPSAEDPDVDEGDANEAEPGEEEEPQEEFIKPRHGSYIMSMLSGTKRKRC